MSYVLTCRQWGCAGHLRVVRVWQAHGCCQAVYSAQYSALAFSSSPQTALQGLRCSWSWLVRRADRELASVRAVAAV